jgi:hypothetical protein
MNGDARDLSGDVAVRVAPAAGSGFRRRVVVIDRAENECRRAA